MPTETERSRGRLRPFVAAAGVALAFSCLLPPGGRAQEAAGTCCAQPLGLDDVLGLIEGKQEATAIGTLIGERCVDFEINVVTTNRIMGLAGAPGAGIVGAAQAHFCAEPQVRRVRLRTEERDTAALAARLAEAYLRARGGTAIRQELSGVVGKPPRFWVVGQFGEREIGFDIQVTPGDSAAAYQRYQADAVMVTGALPELEGSDELNEHDLALDRPVVIVNRHQPLGEIAVEDLRRVLCAAAPTDGGGVAAGGGSGGIRWSELGGAITVDGSDAVHVYRAVEGLDPAVAVSAVAAADDDSVSSAGPASPASSAAVRQGGSGAAGAGADRGGASGAGRCRVDERQARAVADVAAAVSADPLGLGVVRLGGLGNARELPVRHADSATVIVEQPVRLYVPRIGARPRSMVSLTDDFAAYLRSGPGQAVLDGVGLAPVGDLASEGNCPAKVCSITRGTMRKLTVEIKFPFGGYAWTESARQVAAAIAEVRSQSFGRPLILKGFTDDQGSVDAACTVSRLRAETARDRLAAAGLQVAEIAACGLRTDNNETRRGRAGNRVVEVWVSNVSPR